MKSLSRFVLVLAMVLLSTASLAQEKTTYRTRDGRSWIRLVSSNELEYRHEGTTFLCKYSVQDESLRVILTVLGTQQVLYFKRTPEGYASEQGESYMTPAAIADLQRREQAAREAQQRAQQAQAARRAEEERLAREAAQREAEVKRLADERASKESERLLRVFLPSHPTLYATWNDFYNPRKMMLKITSFDLQTGSVTGESDNLVNIQKPGNVPNSVVGNVSGGTLNLTLLGYKSPIRLRLRYDPSGPKLVGDLGDSEHFYLPVVYSIE
jgi:type II secretory pathway pseudopilin PulG